MNIQGMFSELDVAFQKCAWHRWTQRTWTERHLSVPAAGWQGFSRIFMHFARILTKCERFSRIFRSVVGPSRRIFKDFEYDERGARSEDGRGRREEGGGRRAGKDFRAFSGHFRAFCKDFPRIFGSVVGPSPQTPHPQ